ncbi:major facilitator superfamily domain-containing protein [Ochromonadaceae sp. CCMP2298]|nr:major facilitator superfamily domain-containing protein [Ochromonadaceae sp. CCMP2298]
MYRRLDAHVDTEDVEGPRSDEAPKPVHKSVSCFALYGHFQEQFRSLESCPRELWINFVLKFCESYCYFAISQILVLYLHEEFGLTDVRAGATYGMWGASITFWGLAISWLNDRFGVRSSLLLGFSISAISSIFLATATSATTIYLILFCIMPVGTAMGIPMLTVGIKRYTHPGNRGFAFGLFYSVMNVAAFVSGPVVDLLNIGCRGGVRAFGRSWSGYRLVILTTSVVYVTSLVVTYRYLRETRYEEGTGGTGAEVGAEVGGGGGGGAEMAVGEVEDRETEGSGADAVADAGAGNGAEGGGFSKYQATCTSDSDSGSDSSERGSKNPRDVGFKSRTRNPLSALATHDEAEVGKEVTDSGLESVPVTGAGAGVAAPSSGFYTSAGSPTSHISPSSHTSHTSHTSYTSPISHPSPTPSHGSVVEYTPKAESFRVICGELVRSPTFWRFALFTLFLINLRTVFRHLDATLPTYLVRCFGANVPKGLIYSINPLLIMFLTPVVAALTSHHAHFDMIKYGGYITAISPFFLAASTSIWAVVCFVVVLSLGEAVWSPRTYDYTMSIAPEGREASFSALASAPLFAAKVPVGLLSGYLIATYLPENGESHREQKRDGQTLWLIIGLVTMTSPILITVFERFIREPIAPPARSDKIEAGGGDGGGDGNSHGPASRSGSRRDEEEGVQFPYSNGADASGGASSGDIELSPMHRL